MLNNFRVGANIYVSKAGQPGNAGTGSQTDPKLTIAGANVAVATGQSITIGSGQYDETFSAASATGVIYRSDGYVKIRGGSLGFNGVTVYGITFENQTNFAATNSSSFFDCVFFGCTFPNSISFTRCIFINCTFASAATQTVDYCIFINTVIYAGVCTNSYFNSASTYRIKSGTNLQHNYNNVMSPIYVGSTYYADLAAQKAATGYNTNSFNLPPKYNNVSKLDFTLQYDSPHILAAADQISNIGGTSYAKTTLATGEEWKVVNGAVYSTNNGANVAANGVGADIVLSGLDMVLDSGKLAGYVISAPIKISANPVVLDYTFYNGALLFNKAQTSGGVLNNNVPDASINNNASGVAGANPDRLSYEIRYTDNDTQPGSDTDWINGYNTAPGGFIKMELFGAPRVDPTGKGSGEGDYSNSVNSSISVVWVQLKITLTNQYA